MEGVEVQEADDENDDAFERYFVRLIRIKRRLFAISQKVLEILMGNFCFGRKRSI